jgi:hypothetical protein
MLCRDAFTGTFQIPSKRLRKNQASVVADDPGVALDKRVKHVKIYVSEQKRLEVRDHIKSFPCMQSHYSRTKNKKRKYPQLT